MNAAVSPREFVLTMLAVVGVLLSALLAHANPADETHVTLQASFLLEIVSDRARLVQVSLVAVAFGIAILWWKK